MLLPAPPLVARFAWPKLIKAWRYRKHSPEGQSYTAVAVAKRWKWAAHDLLLAAFLALMAHDVHEMLEPMRR